MNALLKKSFVGAFAFIVSWSVAFGAYPNTYEGTFGANYSMTTVLCLEAGNLQGNYTFQYAGETYKGTLTDLVLTDHSLTGTWNDDYGSGAIEFNFDPNFSSFTGHYMWGSTPWDWNGALVSNQIEKLRRSIDTSIRNPEVFE